MRQSPKAQAHSKFLIKPKNIQDRRKQSTNIFHSTSEESDIDKLGTLTMYSIVGDSEFKEKFYKQRTMETWRGDETLDQTQKKGFNNTSVIDGKFIKAKMTKFQSLQATRDRRNIKRIKQMKEKEKQMAHYLMEKSGKKWQGDPHETVTYGTIKTLYSFPNPQKIDLINDNIPQYWKNSLRDNEKRLKRHLKGNTFRKEEAEEMLQTLRGRSMIQRSIPRIKDEYIVSVCSKKGGNKSKGFTLNGIKLNRHKQEHVSTGKKTQRLEEIHKFKYNQWQKWKLHVPFSS